MFFLIFFSKEEGEDEEEEEGEDKAQGNDFLMQNEMHWTAWAAATMRRCLRFLFLEGPGSRTTEAVCSPTPPRRQRALQQ